MYIDQLITIGEYIYETQPQIYKILKQKYPILTRRIIDQQEFYNLKRLMEEDTGVIFS